MIEWVVAGRFLTLGLVAGVAAIVLGTGAFFRLWGWRQRWPMAGTLGGLAAFGLWVAAHAVEMATLAGLQPSLIGLGGTLSAGCGIALAYGSLFPPTHTPRPVLEPGTPEARLWLLDAADRLHPEPLDWILTGTLLIPGIGMTWLGLTQILLPGPVVLGLASVAAPLYAAAGLGLRRRSARAYLAEVEADDLSALAAPDTAVLEGPRPDNASFA